ncbi:MAG: nicotinate phosphoribosyltransferase [Balneolales bacterium]
MKHNLLNTITGTYTDQYQLTMAQVYFLKGKKDHTAVFDYFFRKLPFEGGYAVFAGLDDLLDLLENLHFDEQDIDFIREQGFHPEFIRYLQDFRFSGTIYSNREGNPVFPILPVLSVEAGIIEAQLIETLLLNILNYQTLIATKASRMRYVAGDRKLMDFGLRRAQGAGGFHAARAAVIGGFDSTSNVRAGRDYQIPVSGTMAHSFVQSYDNERTAFRDFAAGRPDDCVLLVDTYDTLSSGVPNAIAVGKEMEANGYRLKGIRLDSGDLAWLARQSRKALDEAGLGYVKIAGSNQIDEYVIRSLTAQQAPIDLFGIGTSLVTGRPDAALDGVYKLAFAHNKPRIKLSESIAKITLPHRKQVFRVMDEEGLFYGADAAALAEEKSVETMHHTVDPLKSLAIKAYGQQPQLHKVMEHGARLTDPLPLNEIRQFSGQRLQLLPPEYQRFENPHIYKVGISARLKKERDHLVEWAVQQLRG